MKNTLVGKMAWYLKAVSEEQRLKILKILASSMAESVCVSDVANYLGISQPAATKHLKILENVGLLVRKRKGTSVYYILNNNGLMDLRNHIDKTFAKGYTKCPFKFNCDDCPHGETCI